MSIDNSRARVGKKLLDRLALLGSALLFIAVGGGVFLWADKYHVNDAWVFGGWISLIFFGIVGWPFRNRLRQLPFVMFFLAWLVVHLLIFFSVVSYLSPLHYLLVIPLELLIGYSLAIWLFGPPADRRQ